MKAAHRHELESNALAHRLEAAIDRFRPYGAVLAGIILAIVVVMFIWSYVAGSSAARQDAAWDAYHRGVSSGTAGLDELRRTAEEYPGTKMQQLADMTWADGQVFIASERYLYNRQAAQTALDRAASVYQGVLQKADDERMVNRAHLGLARIYEMRNELDRSREEFLKVTGAFEQYAKQQAERLADPQTREDYAWLAKAEATPPRAPAGPGTPGQRPAFAPSDLSLPGGTPDANAPGGAAPEGGPTSTDSYEKLLREFDLNFPKDSKKGPDRYDTGTEPSANEQAPPSEKPESK